MDIRKLQLDQMSKALNGIQIPARPSVGWVQSIRKAVGMTTRQLAERMGVTQSTVVALEQSEAHDKITLTSLHRAADALDCELHYVLVPRQNLRAKVESRALSVASKTVGNVTHTMRLEDQEPSSNFAESIVHQEAVKILTGRWGKLWEK